MKEQTGRTVRFAAVLMLAALLLGSFAACKGTGKDPVPTQTSAVSTPGPEGTTAPQEVVADIPDRKMDFDLVLLNYTDAGHGYSIKTMVVEERDSDMVREAIYNRNMAIEEKYDCLITEQQAERTWDRIQKDALIGSSEYHVALVYEEDVNKCLLADALALYEEIPYLNTEKPWWNDSASDIYSYGGHQYAGVGDWCLSMYSKLHAYLLNKDFMNTVALEDDLYDLVRDREWTLEKMFEIAALYGKDVDGEDQDTYGVVGTSKVHFQLLLTGSGLKYIEKDDNGYHFALTDETSYRMIDRIMTLSAQYYYNNQPESANAGVNAKEFIENRVLLLAGIITTLSSLSNDAAHVGVLPAPLYDEDQDDYHTIAVGGLLTCFPGTLKQEDAENVGILVEALCYASWKDLVPLYQEKLLKIRRADSPDDSEMMDILFRTMSFDLGCSTWAKKIRLPIMENIFHTGLKGIVSSYMTGLAGTLDEEEFGAHISAIYSRYYRYTSERTGDAPGV